MFSSFCYDIYMQRYKNITLLLLFFFLAAACNTVPVYKSSEIKKTDRSFGFVSENVRGGEETLYAGKNIVTPTPESKDLDKPASSALSVPPVAATPKVSEQACNTDLSCLIKAVKNNCQVFSATLTFSGDHPLASGLASYTTTRLFEIKGGSLGKCEVLEKYLSGEMQYKQGALVEEIKQGSITKESADQFKSMQEDLYKKTVSKTATCDISPDSFVQHLNDYTQGYLYSDIPIFVTVSVNNDPYSSSCKGSLYNN